MPVAFWVSATEIGARFTIFEQVGHTVRLNITRDGKIRTVDVPVADVSGLMQG
jgi:hypothetical protein